MFCRITATTCLATRSLILVGWLLLPSVAGEAATLTVGPNEQNFAHIQEAIDSATTGGEIIVSTSRYTERLLIRDEDIILSSTDPADPSVREMTRTSSESLRTYELQMGKKNLSMFLSNLF